MYDFKALDISALPGSNIGPGSLTRHPNQTFTRIFCRSICLARISGLVRLQLWCRNLNTITDPDQLYPQAVFVNVNKLLLYYGPYEAIDFNILTVLTNLKPFCSVKKLHPAMTWHYLSPLSWACTSSEIPPQSLSKVLRHDWINNGVKTWVTARHDDFSNFKNKGTVSKREIPVKDPHVHDMMR